VPTGPLLLALCAAFVHAGWNLLLSRARDSEQATATAAAIGALAFAPVAALTWDVSAKALPYAAISAVLELVYLMLLARAYQEGELSLVYPVARGSAPVLVLLFTVIVLGAAPSTAAIAGIALVAGGVVLVRGGRGSADPRHVRLALAIAVAIASYTLIDKQGVKHADPLPYLELSVAPPALAYLLITKRRKGLAPVKADTLLAGLGIFGAYALALSAIRLASTGDVPSVQAVRESSVVIAVLLARATLGERVTGARLAGAVAVVSGVAAIALA
jgi:drug/metabolite transporter (DMT)-like permease